MPVTQDINLIDMQITKVCITCGDDFECSEEFAYGIHECRKCVIEGYEKVDRILEYMLLNCD